MPIQLQELAGYVRGRHEEFQHPIQLWSEYDQIDSAQILYKEQVQKYHLDEHATFRVKGRMCDPSQFLDRISNRLSHSRNLYCYKSHNQVLPPEHGHDETLPEYIP